jgi:hypothetical protein
MDCGKKIQTEIMEEFMKYMADNYEGLYEIYITKVNDDNITFENFCLKMYHEHLKNLN